MLGSRLRRRDLLKGVAGLVAITPLLAACAGQPAATQPAATPAPSGGTPQQAATPAAQATGAVAATAAPKSTVGGQLMWWAWGNEESGFPVWRSQIAIFNQKYPDVTFDLQPNLGYDKVAVAMAAGTAADILMINMPSGYAFIGHGHILNLQPYIAADKSWQDDLAVFHQGSLDAYTYKSELYAIPQSLETTGTIYNEDMVKAAGLTPPAELGTEWTWQKFQEYAAAMTKGEGREKVYGAYVSPDPQSGLGDLVYPLGARWVKEDGVSTGIDADEFIQGANFITDLVRTHKAAPEPAVLTGQQAPNAYALFINLNIGMMLSGDWAFGWVLTRQLPDKQFKMNWAPSPYAPNGKYAAVGHYVAQAGYAKSKNQDAVVAFLREYATKAVQDEITNHWENYPALAPRMDAQDFFWEKKLIPNEEGLRASFEANLPYPRTPVGDVTPIVIQPTNAAINAILDGNDSRSPEAVLKELATKVNGDLDKAASNIGG